MILQDTDTEKQEFPVPPKKPLLQQLHEAVILLTILIPSWILSCFCSMPLTLFLILTAIIISVTAKIVCKKSENSKLIFIIRILAVLSVLLIQLPVVVTLNFEQTKLFYPLKHEFYDSSDPFLPESLPKECKDYCFITKASFPAQDYHPYALLAFHTDRQSLDEYAAYLNSLEHIEFSQNQPLYDPEYLEKCQKQGIEVSTEQEYPPAWLAEKLLPAHQENFDHAYIWHSPSGGCAVNYNSGFVLIWT